jgi:release factor glutamine methyltransferase
VNAAPIWTTGKVLSWATSDFSARGVPSARLEAELLLAHVLGCQRLELYVDHERPLDPEELGAFRETIARRRRGEPAAYILGIKEFWSLELEITADVLVPRPETEILVQACLARVARGPVLDLCTGSGCVALALASERAEMRIDASDVSPAACAVARRNAERHGLADRVAVIEGDLFTCVPPDARYEAITSNPPYVIDDELAALAPEVRAEPRLALAGGDDGLDVIRRILAGAPDHLASGGWLLLELDPRQARAVACEIGPTSLGTPGEIVRDLAGRERVVAFRFGG